MTPEQAVAALVMPHGLDAGLDAMEAKMRDLGETPLDWRLEIDAEGQGSLRAILQAGIAAALDVDKLVHLIAEARAVCDWQVKEGRGRFATLEDALAAFSAPDGGSHE